MVVSGRVDALTFDDDGIVTARESIGEGARAVLVEIPERTWHTLVCLSPETVVFEVKAGPYVPTTDKDFAPWAPAPQSEEVEPYVRWLEAAAPGERYR